MKAPLPENETERLAALHGLSILDTPPELAYDELSALAAYICQTPIALISLVDEDRQWFKSRVGWTAEETPRDVAFCAHAILQPDLFIIPDASADERFAKNPLVTSPPSIRFYAAAPLVTGEGHAVGTLCVIDHKPRDLTAEQARALRALSHQVVAQLRLRKQLLEQTRINAELAEANETLRVAIAHRQRTEQALCESEQWLDLAMRISRQGPWEADLVAQRVTPSNQILGLPGAAGPIALEEFAALVHPNDSAARAAALDDVMSGRSSLYKAEYRMRDGKGQWTWVYSCGQVIEHDAAGRPSRMIGMALDVTERKAAEDALRESEERFRGTFENAGVGIAHADFEGRWLRVNEKLCAIVGYTREELLHKTFQDITHPADLPASLDHVARLRRGEFPSYSLEKRYVRKDGSPVWVDLSVSLQRDAAGTPAYSIAIIQDNSERKRLEGELRQAKEAAEAANRAKSEFLAHVSHEIRTPLNAILGMNELALDAAVTDQQRKYLAVMQSAAEGLLDVINDLLDFSKIEAGKLELDQATFSLRTVVNDTLRSLALRAHRKGLELVGRIRPDVPDAFVGDAGRLRQVLTNLVGNAVKFTEEGEVVVEVVALAEENGRGRGNRVDPEANVSCGPLEPKSPPCALFFSVRDTGIGIPHDKQEKIFQAFEQADSSTTRRYGGTGLGLSIASRLVRLMDGRILVESEPGRGSTFRFTVRLQRPLLQPDRAAAQAPAELHGLRVLVVDDNATTRRALEEWLRAWQTEPRVVADGATALDELRRAAAAGRPLALVVLDSRLPGTDALALAAEILQTPEVGAGGILLLTVEDQARELRRYRELGIAACVMKPVGEEEFLDAVCRARSLPSPVVAAGGRWASACELGTQAAGEPVSARRFHVLVAEDNPYNQAVMEDLLPRRGHTVRVADDGQAALAALEQDHFDVMLLDIHMPELDGFQVVAAVRQREQGTGLHLPVIALTARSAAGERERCLQAGMDDYLAKPVRAAELFAAIDRVAEKKKADGRRRTRDDDRPHPSSVTRPPSEPGLLDPVALLAACDGDAELLRKMCRHFQAFVPDRLAEVGAALRDRDIPRLREAAHKLGGMVSSFSATAAETTALLGRLGSEGKIEEAIQTHSHLTEIVGRLISELDTLSVEQLR
jgi:PAS domain S-box-containing protein